MNKYLLILLFTLVSNSSWATSYNTNSATLTIPVIKVMNGNDTEYYNLVMSLETTLDNVYVFNTTTLTKLENIAEFNEMFDFADNILNLSKVSVIANDQVIGVFNINMTLELIFDNIITLHLNSVGIL
jgi:hypothetical protein